MAAAVVLAVLVGGVVLGRGTAPETVAPVPSAPAPSTVTVTPSTSPAPTPAPSPSPAPTVTIEAVALTVEEPGITIETSGLVAHTWGVELRMSGRGFDKGVVFQAAFRSSETGDLETAGAFIGTGRNQMTCNLQSALMRAQATEVVITNASGRVVLDAPL